jgi:hypothetical protein
MPLASFHDCDVRNKSSGYVNGITYIHTHVLVTGSPVWEAVYHSWRHAHPTLDGNSAMSMGKDKNAGYANSTDMYCKYAPRFSVYSYIIIHLLSHCSFILFIHLFVWFIWMAVRISSIYRVFFFILFKPSHALFLNTFTFIFKNSKLLKIFVTHINWNPTCFGHNCLTIFRRILVTAPCHYSGREQ